MVRVSRSVLMCLCLALAACSVEVATEEATCKNDLDCKGDRICSGGNCVTPDTVGATEDGTTTGVDATTGVETTGGETTGGETTDGETTGETTGGGCDNQCIKDQAISEGAAVRTCVEDSDGCLALSDGVVCEDAHACTDDVCANGECQFVADNSLCDDGAVCTDDTCLPEQGCVNDPNTAACDDDDLCTQDTVCANGECVGGSKIECNDSDPCTEDFCSSSDGCGATFSDTHCNTGEGCVAAGCDQGHPLAETNGCYLEQVHADCNDGIDCTIDVCLESGKCDAEPNDNVCDGTECSAGFCALDKGCSSQPKPCCVEYCDAVTAACTGGNAQYSNVSACLSYCAEAGVIPAGEKGDTEGNSVGCRTTFAKEAAISSASATLNCPLAGPSGGGVCGGYCDVYCQLTQQNCTGAQQLYGSADDCVSTCVTMNATGSPGATEGDSVQCRIYHAGVAGTDQIAPVLHCPHASEDGGGVCAADLPNPTCSNYCDTVTASCTDENVQYAGFQSCMDICKVSAPFPQGQSSNTSGNTLGCRSYHAQVAAADPTTHCSHAGPGGGGMCGSWCENYCHFTLAHCTGTNALYSGLNACMTSCANFPDNAPNGATSGDSVQCRTYHATVAGLGSPVVHCPHASKAGGGVCEDVVIPGDTCEAAIKVPGIPFTFSGDTSDCADQFAIGGSCTLGFQDATGAGRPDMVFKWTVPETATYTLSLNGAGTPAASPTWIYVQTDCGVPASCSQQSEDLYNGGTWSTTFKEGKQLFIILDGQAATDVGTYTFTIGKGALM